MIKYNELEDEVVEIDEETVRHKINDSLEMELLISNISNQLYDREDRVVNHLEVYLATLSEWEDALKDNQDLYRDLEERKNMVLAKVIRFISKKFKINTDIEDVDRELIASAMYEFFIYEFEENITQFLAGYIENNPNSFDIYRTSSSVVEKDTNEHLDMNKLSKAIKNIMEDIEIDNSTFISTLYDRNDSYSVSQIYTLYKDNRLDFDEDIKDILYDILNEDRGTYYEIIVSVATELSDMEY